MKNTPIKNEVRLGIIGTGAMGTWHADSILGGKVRRVRLSAVCDVRPEATAKYRGIPSFNDSRKLVRSGTVDAVLISAPHYFHTSIGIDALDNGLHVLTEKPLAVSKSDAVRMVQAHARNRKMVFAAMYQLRTANLYRKIRSLVKGGELGRLRRILWTVTDWFRSDAYYASSDWRATWQGEGGGLLTNQCVHNLDLWQWMFGMPEKVRGFCGFGRYHAIEVEDDVAAYFSYRDGTTGMLVSSSGEAPGINRLEVVGDRGQLVVENREISFQRTEVSTEEFCRKTPTAYEVPDFWRVKVPCPAGGGDHADVISNFADAIIDGTPLVAPAGEGMNQVELSNAIVYSGLMGVDVRLPMKPAAFSGLLKRLVRGSKKRSVVAPRMAGEVPRYIVGR